MTNSLKILSTVILIGIAATISRQFHQNSDPFTSEEKKPLLIESQKRETVLLQNNFLARIESDDELFQRATNAIATSPELALAIARKFLDDDPADENARAASILIALTEARQFQTALQLVNEAPPDSRADWLNVTFTRWAQSQPQDAVKNLDSISDNDSRTQAFQSLANGWAASDPSALADYATSLSDDANRIYALNKALDNWSLQDPAGLAAWLNTSPRGVDLDRAIAKMISKADGANYGPDVAASWVENIGDPALRYDSLKHVLAQWAQTDSAAAQKYLTDAAWLDERQRTEIFKTFSGAADQN